MVDSKSYQDAVKNTAKILANLKGSKKAGGELDTIFDNISSNLFGINKSSWFENVGKSVEDFKKQAENIKKMRDDLNFMSNDIGVKLSTAISDSFKGADKDLKHLGHTSTLFVKVIKDGFKSAIGKGLNVENFQKVLKSTSAMTEEDLDAALKKAGINSAKLGIDLGKALDLKNQIRQSDFESNEIIDKILESSKLTDKFGSKELARKVILATAQDMALKTQEKMTELVGKEGDALFKASIANKEIGDAVGDQLLKHGKIKGKINDEEIALKEVNKEMFTWQKGVRAIGVNLAKNILSKIVEFDTALHDVQKNTGIAMQQNSGLFSDVVVQSAQFGMNAEDAGKAIEAVAEGMRTTDASTISVVKDFAEFSQATGAAYEDIEKISNELMRGGGSIEDMRDAMKEATSEASHFGVSSKKVVAGVAANLEKMRNFGFTGGVESLIKMTAQATRLRMDISSVFDMASKARTLEGSLEMASQLQLAGGSFANANPIELLGEARNSPEELMKILSSMGSEMAQWNDKTKKYDKFDPVDVDRLKIVAEATGVQLDDLQKMIQRKAEDNKKLEFFPPSMFQITGLDTDAIQAQMSDALEIGKDKKITVKADSIFRKFGFDTLEKMKALTADQIKAVMHQQEVNDEDLKKRAEENMGLKKSWTAFTDTVANLFTVLEPALKFLTGVIQGLTNILKNGWGQFIAGTLLLAAFFPKFITIAGKMTKSVTTIASSFTKKGIKSLFNKGKDALNEKPPSTDKIGDLAKTEKSISKDAGSGIKTFMTNLAKGFESFGNGKVTIGILNFGLALVILLGSLVGFIYLMTGVPPETLIESGAAILGLAGIIKLISLMKIDSSGIIKTSIAMFLIGIAMIPFAFAMSLMGKTNWETILIDVLLILGIMGIMALIGLTIEFTGPLIIAGAILLLGAGIALLAASVIFMQVGKNLDNFGVIFDKLSKIDWDMVMKMGKALGVAALAIAGFSLSAAIFLNPFTMLGMAAMIISLGFLSAVMGPLAESLNLAGQGLNTMASGLAKLGDAVKNLDLGKLSQLKDISDNLASASTSSAMADALTKFAQALNGAKGGAGATAQAQQPIIIQLKLPNGRVMEEVRINDLNKAS